MELCCPFKFLVPQTEVTRVAFGFVCTSLEGVQQSVLRHHFAVFAETQLS